MSKSQIQIFTDYIPAQLYEGKTWYIGYYVKNPASGDLVRQRIKFNRIQSKVDRRREAKRVISEINENLRKGWNPFLEAEAPKGFHLLVDTFETYMRIKKKELRYDSFRTYRSYIDILRKWIEEMKKLDIYVINFSRGMARDFLTEQYQRAKVGERDYNNKLAFYRRFWNWLIENDYTKNNPFDGITKKVEKHKSRIQFIEENDRALIRDFFYERNRRFYVLAMMAYHCLIRPKEITYLKFKYINIKEQYILIPGIVGKNKKDRFSTIPHIFMHEIKWLLEQNHDPEDYIFSQDVLRPGKKKMDPRRINKWWNRLRESTSIDNNIQFYSLRDTGIIQKLRDGVSPDEVMYQADHSSLEVTNKYVKIAKPRVLENVKNLASEF